MALILFRNSALFFCPSVSSPSPPPPTPPPPGGGWQDQVGGLVGGVKVGRSRASLPLQVEVQRLSPPEEFLLSLEKHLLLVYTGKTRLARNLLQVGTVVHTQRFKDASPFPFQRLRFE